MAGPITAMLPVKFIEICNKSSHVNITTITLWADQRKLPGCNYSVSLKRGIQIICIPGKVCT